MLVVTFPTDFLRFRLSFFRTHIRHAILQCNALLLRLHFRGANKRILYRADQRTFVWYFDLNVLLFVWLGNDTFAHWRQLPGSLWAVGCAFDHCWSLAGRVAQCCGSYAQFFVLLCNFEQKPAVLCTYIRYNYKVV